METQPGQAGSTPCSAATDAANRITPARSADDRSPLCFAFEVPENASLDIQVMTVWAKAFEMLLEGGISPEHQAAALQWFAAYAKAGINKQSVTDGR